MTRQQPISVQWLWSQHNEHRVPLARLIMLAMYRLCPDFRVCMYLNVLMMAVMAGLLIRCAHVIRGRVAVTDVFFPLVLIGFSQGLNFIWAWQVEFFVSTAIALFVLLIISGYRETNPIKAAAQASIGLALLVICGAHGLALVPALALWTAVIALFGFPENIVSVKRFRALLFTLSAAVLCLVGFYFWGYQKVPYFPTSPSARHTVYTALQFLTMSFGPAAEKWWPLSGIITTLVLALATALIVETLLRQRSERVRAMGFLLFLGAMTSLGLAVGLGRSGFEPRYITLSVPVLRCAYLIFVVYARGRLLRVASQGMLAIALICFPHNFQVGMEYGRSLRANLASFEAEMRAGEPPHALIHKHMAYLHPNTQILDDYLPFLRRAGIGRFRFLSDNPQFKETTVPLTPIGAHSCDWNGRTGSTTGKDGSIVFAVPQAQYVDGIRIRYAVKNRQGTPPFFSIAWRSSFLGPFTKEKSYYVSPTGDRANWERGSWPRIGRPESELTLWVSDQVREIRIQPDAQPCAIRASIVRPSIER